MQRHDSRDDIDNIDAYAYYKFYLKISRTFSIIWFILTICFTIALILVFVQPNWIGDTQNSASRGYFGIYEFCVRSKVFNNYNCYGKWNDFNAYPNNTTSFKVACVFLIAAIILSFIVIFIYFLSICIKFERIFHVCSWIQFFITILVFLSVVILPAGWNSNIVRSVCGMEANRYLIGTCALRWPYIVASMLAFQILLLTIFAVFLSSRQAKYILAYTDQAIHIHNSYTLPKRTTMRN